MNLPQAKADTQYNNPKHKVLRLTRSVILSHGEGLFQDSNLRNLSGAAPASAQSVLSNCLKRLC